MPLTDPALWARIDAHPMPDSSDGTTFAQQLCADHKIKPNTSRAAIAEYKRFLYLSSLDQGRSVPTKAVDEVWHLHLTHTRDYWETLVPEALAGRPVHHSPGSVEGQSEDFDATRARYEAEFDEEPPKGFWKQRTRSDVRKESYAWGGFGILMLGVAWATGAPTFFLAITAIFFAGPLISDIWQGMKASDTEEDMQIGIAVWADGDAGDCGSSDGGGCGD